MEVYTLNEVELGAVEWCQKKIDFQVWAGPPMQRCNTMQRWKGDVPMFWDVMPRKVERDSIPPGPTIKLGVVAMRDPMPYPHRCPCECSCHAQLDESRCIRAAENDGYCSPCNRTCKDPK